MDICTYDVNQGKWIKFGDTEHLRAYELLRHIHTNNFIITTAIQAEINELFKEEWELEILD